MSLVGCSSSTWVAGDSPDFSQVPSALLHGVKEEQRRYIRDAVQGISAKQLQAITVTARPLLGEYRGW